MRNRSNLTNVGRAAMGTFPTAAVCLLWGLLAFPATAAETSTAARLAEVRNNIAVAQQINIELKAQLADRDKEAASLKSRLQQLEDQIAALKKEHHL